MIDPLSLSIVFAGLSLQGFGQSIGNRLASRYISTPLEDSQREGVAVQRERLRDERQRHEERLAFDRERHREEISARFELQIQQTRLQGWPLSVSAPDIIDRSGANSSNALNVFLFNRASKDSHSARMVMSAFENIILWSHRHYSDSDSSHPIIPYIQALSTNKSIPAGEAFVSTLYGMLKHEPTLIFEITCLSENKMRMIPTYWGFGHDYGNNSPPRKLDIIDVDLIGNPENDFLLVTVAIRAYLAGMIDIFHVANMPDNIRTPIITKTVVSELSKNELLEKVSIDKMAKLLPPVYSMYKDIAPALGFDASIEMIRRLYNEGSEALAKEVFSLLCDQIMLSHKFRGTRKSWSDIDEIQAMLHFSYVGLDSLLAEIGEEKTRTINRLPMQERGFRQ